MSEFPELGFYVLAGGAGSSRDLLQEVRDGEALRPAAASAGDLGGEGQVLCGGAQIVDRHLELVDPVSGHQRVQL